MEQFFLVPASVYNKSAQSVTKQELPKYKAEQPPTYQIDSLGVPDICFTLLDAAGISPSLIFNQNAKTEDRGSLVPFKM